MCVWPTEEEPNPDCFCVRITHGSVHTLIAHCVCAYARNYLVVHLSLSVSLRWPSVCGVGARRWDPNITVAVYYSVFFLLAVTVGTSEIQKLGNIFLQVRICSALSYAALRAHVLFTCKSQLKIIRLIAKSIVGFILVEVGHQEGELHWKRPHGYEIGRASWRERV